MVFNAFLAITTAHADHCRQGALEKQLQDGCRSVSLLVHYLVKYLSISVLIVIATILLEETKIDLMTVYKVYKSEPILYVFGTICIFAA